MNEPHDTQAVEEVKQNTPEFVKLDTLSGKIADPAPETPTSDKHGSQSEGEPTKAGSKELADNKDAELLLSK